MVGIIPLDAAKSKGDTGKKILDAVITNVTYETNFTKKYGVEFVPFV
jgi:hypothetical protein